MIKAFEKSVYCLFQFEFEEIQFSKFYIPIKKITTKHNTRVLCLNC